MNIGKIAQSSAMDKTRDLALFNIATMNNNSSVIIDLNDLEDTNSEFLLSLETHKEHHKELKDLIVEARRQDSDFLLLTH